MYQNRTLDVCEMMDQSRAKSERKSHATGSRVWDLVSLHSGRVLGSYSARDFRQAVRDAAMMRAHGIACDVRKVV